MAMILIQDETRNRINKLILQEKKINPDYKINQDYIVRKGLDLLEELK